MKNQKGITLVALIITIIVMVILAAVIIISAVADGGIIDRAEDAMKEKERAEAEELVIASYVYKTTASMTTVGTLNLAATADAIYENLTSNGFTLMDGNTQAGAGSDILEGDKIDLNIIGRHGNYTGTVTEKGLQGNLKPLEEANNDTAGDTADNTNTDEEIIWGEYEGGLWYIGNSKNLIINSDKILVEEIIVNYDDYTYTTVEGTKKEKTFEDYYGIDFKTSPNTEKIDFGNKLSAKNMLSFYDNNTIQEVKGLEGLIQIDGFGYTNSLNVVILPSTASEIKDWGFERNTAINTITIPGNVKKIGNESFRNCSNLINITIEKGVEYIGERAFYDTSLEKITIPSSMKYIGNNAFSGYLSTLKQVTIEKTKAEVEAEGGIGTAWIPSSVTKIIYSDQTVDLTQNT